MHTASVALTSERHSCLLTIARAQDAQLSAVSANLSPDAVTRLRASLDRLVEIGAIAIYRLDTPLIEADDWEAIVDFLREQVGSLPTDAAVAATMYPATPTPKAQTLVSIWPFERLSDDPDVLTASGIFMGMPMTFEAFQFLEPEATQPAPEVASRFSAWQLALRKPAMIGKVIIPGSQAAHAVFAYVQAS